MYPTLFRMTPEDQVHYGALIKYLQHMGWNWVGILTSWDGSGDEEAQDLSKMMSQHGICIDYIIQITPDPMKLSQNARIISESAAKVVIICFHDPILEDIWINGFGCLSPNPHKNYYFQLIYGFSAKDCRDIKDLSEMFDAYAALPTYAYRAVNVLAHALHGMLMEKKTSEPNGFQHRLHMYVRNVHYTDLIEDEIYFNERKEIPTDLILQSWVFVSNAAFYHIPISMIKGPDFVPETFPDMSRPGFWKRGKIFSLYDFQIFSLYDFQIFSLYDFQIFSLYDFPDFQPVTSLDIWVTTTVIIIIIISDFQVPVSRCSDPCIPGTSKAFGSSVHTCCYECVSCPEGESSNISDSEICMKCPDDEWSNKKRDRCVPKLLDFLSYTDDTIVGVFSAVSILCCLLTGLILRKFIHYQDTPIVKANNRNLSYLLLVSIMLSFLCVFLFLGHPVDVTCMLRVTSFGVIFSVAVSSLLAKSIMVYIAFKATKPGSPWRKWMGAKLPNFIICVLSLVQVIICVTWLSISPPFQDQDIHSYQGKIIIQCNEGSVIGFYSVLGYMGLLAAVSFIIAFLARTLPDSFNEAKYITFSMLVFCSVWIAMIPAYLSTRGKYMVAVEVFALIASSSGLLGCIFFPKCYIILFRPDLNTKTGLLEN
ncbi:vomeronasal type-2 receptor 26-like, partial [Rana temporaria]|uniref:vomeronasal type-2 receptor 26-like n=1 Tax=Rana temporaria TaxID=8407 RepID=UPI001AAC9614